MEIKELFEKAENGTLTYEQFEALAKSEKANFADLSEGGYVSKNKYTDDIKAKENTIADLNSTIKTRETDLKNLQKQLEDVDSDNNEALKTAQDALSDLQTRYDNETKQYKAQLKKQEYEFAVKEFANTKEFTSNAAKRDFISSMIAKELKMEDSTILGAEDFANVYAESNADAFVAKKVEEVEPEVKQEPKPSFIGPTSGSGNSGSKQSLSQLMAAKNENPDLVVNF